MKSRAPRASNATCSSSSDRCLRPRDTARSGWPLDQLSDLRLLRPCSPCVLPTRKGNSQNRGHAFSCLAVTVAVLRAWGRVLSPPPGWRSLQSRCCTPCQRALGAETEGLLERATPHEW